MIKGSWECNWNEDHILVKNHETEEQWKYNLVKEPLCRKCGTPFFRGKRTCGEAVRDEQLELAEGTFQLGRYWNTQWREIHYDDPLTTHILRMKDNEEYAIPIGTSMALLISKKYKELLNVDFMTPVPAFESYNQAKELCDVISDIIYKLEGKKIEVNDCLRKTNDQKMKGLGLLDRSMAVVDMFEYQSEYSLNGKKLILIDDIITTGYTLGECLRILQPHGAEKMWVLVAGANY